MKNKEKFLALVSKEKSNTLERNSERIKNREMLRESQRIAIKVLSKLDELGWSQKHLAKELQVSPQQVTKIISGKENLTIDTQVKLQNILNIPILASYYENKVDKMEEFIVNIEKKFERFKFTKSVYSDYQEGGKIVIMPKQSLTKESSYPIAI